MSNTTVNGNPSKIKSVKKTTSRLYTDLMGQKWKLLLTLIGVGISSLLSIIYPLLLAQAINLIAQEVQLPVQTSNAFTIGIHSMNTLLLLLVGIFSARALFSYLQQYVLASVAENVTLSMRKRISEKLNRVPLRFYDTHKKGDISSRITSDLEKVSTTLQDGISQLLSSFVAMIGALFIMFMISPLLSLIVLGTVFLSLVIASMFTKKNTGCSC